MITRRRPTKHGLARIGILLATLALAGWSWPHCWTPERISPERITDADRLEAMISVHAYARWGRPSAFPRGLETISLARAVGILANDEDLRAPSRRRRAIAKLAAYRLDEFSDAIRALDADPSAIEEALETRSGDAHFEGNASEKETFIADFAPVALQMPTCPWQQLRTWVFGQGPTMVAIAQVSVTRDADSVSRALDPQSWDQCSPLFPSTYLAKWQNGRVQTLPSKPVGTAYGPTTLYEHFRCASGACDFENILGIKAYWEPPPVGLPRRYRVSYWFVQGITPTTGLTLKDDGGELWGREETGGTTTTVFMRKELAFNSDLGTGAAQGIFEVHQDELAGSLAEIACCPVPP